jgi:hypothetical protein
MLKPRATKLLAHERPGLSLFSALLLLALIAVVLVTIVRTMRHKLAVVRTAGGVSAPAVRDGRATPMARPPVNPGFEGCPPEGDGGDRELNRLKNRVDTATWVATPFTKVLDLTWPRRVVRHTRSDWSIADSVKVGKSEGLPVAVEGYFAGAKQEGPEATNCHGADARFRDWHLWLAAEPGKDRRRSIVVETTPEVRATHPEWSLALIHKLVRDSTPVRVSGWLMLDPDHPEQLGKTRGTLWEIHPVLRIEVMRSGRWTELSSRAAEDSTSP